MEKRQEKNNDEVVTTRKSRVEKNQALYSEVNSKIGFEEVTVYEPGAAIDLSKLNEERPRREDYQKIKEYKNLIEDDNKEKVEEVKKENKPKNFDINEVLEEAKKNRKNEDELEKKRNLSEDESVLSNLNRKYLHSKNFYENDSDELK